jgi:hypothetical protein
MANSKPVCPELAEVQPYVQGVGKYLVERLYGPHGPAWGTRFADLEELAVQIGHAVAEQLLQQSVQRQAAEPVPAADEVCPTCERPGDGQSPQPRTVTTRAGDVHWDEPARCCHRCRRSFFPSIQTPGAGPGPLLAGGTPEGDLCGRPRTVVSVGQ